MSKDISDSLQAQIIDAYQSKSALKIQAGNSKHFYGRKVEADLLDVSSHTGIINYEPTELVISARSGTPLAEIEAVLDEQKQMLAFEPPRFSDKASLGGTIACNLSGPRRAYQGAARDYVLGSKIINGKGEILHFGGEVMKNVAGYDASRLMCGAMGTLGVLLDISLKVVPQPEAEVTLTYECSDQHALDNMHQWAQKAIPLSGSFYDGEKLYIRLSGNQASVNSAKAMLGGDSVNNADTLWHKLKEQQLGFFETEQALWRLSLASNTKPLSLQGNTLYEWGGALRWLITDESVDKIRHAAEMAGGHASLFHHSAASHAELNIEAFHELDHSLFAVHLQLKKAFDPNNILNPGRMYTNL